MRNAPGQEIAEAEELKSILCDMIWEVLFGDTDDRLPLETCGNFVNCGCGCTRGGSSVVVMGDEISCWELLTSASMRLAAFETKTVIAP